MSPGMRRHSVYACGVISFTAWHRLTLVEPAQRPAQLQQVDCPKRRAASSYSSELVRRLNICPSRSDPAKSTSLVRIKDPILAPMPASAEQFNLATAERMKGVRDPDLLVRRPSHTTCI
jgi:hypothetical protein